MHFIQKRNPMQLAVNAFMVVLITVFCAVVLVGCQGNSQQASKTASSSSEPSAAASASSASEGSGSSAVASASSASEGSSSSASADVQTSKDSGVSAKKPSEIDETGLLGHTWNDFKYSSLTSGGTQYATGPIEWGYFYGMGSDVLVRKELGNPSSGKRFSAYVQTTSGIRPGSSTIVNFCDTYGATSENAVTQYWTGSLSEWYRFDFDTLKKIGKANSNTYYSVHLAWVFRDGSWQELNTDQVYKLVTNQWENADDTIYLVIAEFSKGADAPIDYVYVCYGSVGDYTVFNK